MLLDTDVCIAIINRDERARPHLERHAPSALRMSSITLLSFDLASPKVSNESGPRRTFAYCSGRSLRSRLKTLPVSDTASFGCCLRSAARRSVPSTL